MRSSIVIDYTEDNQPIIGEVFFTLEPPDPDTDDVPGCGANWTIHKVKVDGKFVRINAEFLTKYEELYSLMCDQVEREMMEEYYNE